MCLSVLSAGCDGCEWLLILLLGLTGGAYKIWTSAFQVVVVARVVLSRGLCELIILNEPDRCFITGDVIGVLACESPEQASLEFVLKIE